MLSTPRGQLGKRVDFSVNTFFAKHPTGFDAQALVLGMEGMEQDVKPSDLALWQPGKEGMAFASEAFQNALNRHVRVKQGLGDGFPTLWDPVPA